MAVRDSRVDDVMDGIRDYGTMAAMISGGNPIVIMMMAEWMSVLMSKLVQWGTLTEDEQQQVQQKLQAETRANEKHAARQQENGERDLLAEMGI